MVSEGKRAFLMTILIRQQDYELTRLKNAVLTIVIKITIVNSTL
jgi:hypothetical protein